MEFTSPIALPYHTYNSLFLSLGFKGIEEVGTHLALFGQQCEKQIKEGLNPQQIIEAFWKERYKGADDSKKMAILRYFIQYVERQVVLFDSVEDSLFVKTHEMNGPGSLKHFLTQITTPEEQVKLLESIQTWGLRLVLTAHPTQFYPGKVLGIINDMGKEIRGNNLENIRLLLMQLGKTSFMNRAKPSPLDEATGLGWFMEHIFFQVMPDILYRLLQALNQDVTSFENPRLLQLGFWPGGDRDGNPFVTADTTEQVADKLRESVLRGYYREIRNIRRRLTFRGVEEPLQKAEHKIYNTLYYPEIESYANCTDLLQDLIEARRALISEHDGLFLETLDRFILKVRVFGFYFASLDIRQDSRKHREVWEAILKNWNEKFPWYSADAFTQADEVTTINRLLTTNYRLDENDFSDAFVKETIRSFRAITNIQLKNGELGCHRYIISNCQNATDVANVLALARLTRVGENTKTNNEQKNIAEDIKIPLDVVPLFETIDDLAVCHEVMRTLYSNEHYSKHLNQRQKTQHIMLGFSDGTKDGGYLRANWSIYLAKENLTAVSREFGVSVIFFDGRGGPPGRGGGNNVSYYAAQGKTIENKAIQVTIQGQTVSSTYGTSESAAFNIERLLTAGLENQIFSDEVADLNDADRQLMNALAESAYQSYLKLKNHANFVPYLEKMTPLKWYGDSNIASRPTKRSGDDALRFEDLRAIPFVGAWAQMKQNVPGYYGLGAALESFKKSKKSDLDGLYQRSLFFRTLLENSMQSLSKSNFDVTRYIKTNEQFGSFWDILHQEYELTITQLLALSKQTALLSDNPNSKSSIAIREKIVLPIIVIQQYALQKLQEPNLTEQEIENYRYLVLRAMFGIINAARNAA